jgi:C_GCAxxG_C_C family probable redox protein
MRKKVSQARNYFKEGYNCCQSVVLPFIQEMDVDENTVMKIASSLGGGLGYLWEVCGAVSGMAVVLGLKYGYLKGFQDDADKEAKAQHYALVKRLGKEFQRRTGALTCRELLHLDENGEPLPGYEDVEKPCTNLVMTGVEILSEYLKESKGK